MSDKNSAFQKHTPQFPLPDEILKMEKDETVCQFCGVSYLIHNEIKKLEDRIKELEINLKDYESLKIKEKDFKQINGDLNLRVQDLEEKLTTRIQMISSLNNDIESRDLDVNRLKKKITDLENENYSLEASNQGLKNKMLKYESVVKETVLKLSAQKSDLKSIEIASKDQLNFMMQQLSNFQSQYQRYAQKLSQDSHEKLEKENSFKSQLNSLSKENEANREKLSSYQKQISALQEVKSELETKISILNGELHKSKEMSSKFLDLEKEKRNYLEENSNLKKELEKVKINSNNLVIEVNELNERIKLKEESVNTVSKNQLNDLKAKNDEIHRLKHDIEQMRKRYDEKEKFENEILNNNQSNLHEINKLKSEIKRLNEEINDHINERKSITLAHQCQITQLKESFKEKMKANDDWQDKMASELKKEREKHANEMQKLEIDLRENFKMELEIHQQKYNEMYAKYQLLNKENESNSKSHINKLESDNQKLINELKNLHEEKLKNEKKLKQDLENLRNITKDLHERLEKYSDESDELNNPKFKQIILEKDTLISELETKLKQYETQLESTKEEIKVLQETVHNECLERQELLEKLDETRDELLQLKKNAYTSQQLIPLNGSLNKSNFSKFKNGTGLIDYSYPKNLNDMDKLNNSQSSSSGTSRRNSSTPNRIGSEKSQPESTSKVIETGRNNIPNPINRETLSLLNTNGNMPSEPIQLFKKINQLSNSSKNQKPGYQTSTLLNSSNSQNKKRISLLLARKH